MEIFYKRTQQAEARYKSMLSVVYSKGVIDINVSTDQIDDRTDEALQFFQEYHFDGVEKTYLKHKVTATTLTVSNSSQFTVGEKITKSTSSATAKIFDAPTSTTIRVFNELGDFQANETITVPQVLHHKQYRQSQ